MEKKDIKSRARELAAVLQKASRDAEEVAENMESGAGQGNKDTKEVIPEQVIIASGSYKVPYEIKLDGFYDYVKDMGPNVFVIGGDMLEVPYLVKLRNRANIDPDSFMEQYVEDIDRANKILDRFDELLPKSCSKVFFEGEREYLIKTIGEKVYGTDYDDLFDVDEILKLTKRGYEIIKYAENCPGVKTMGKMNYVYNNLKGEYNAQKTFIHCMQSNACVFGTSVEETKSFMSAGGENKKKQIRTAGCMCRIPERPFNKNNRHMYHFINGFNFTYMNPIGDYSFNTNNVEITDGKFYDHGKLYGV